MRNRVPLAAFPAGRGARALVLGISVAFLIACPVAAQQGPDGEGALRRALESIVEGRDVTATLTDEAGLDRDDAGHHTALEQKIRGWGAVTSLTFQEMSVHHYMVYDVAFEHAHAEVKVTGISLAGEATGLDFWRYEPDIHPTVVESPCPIPGSIAGTVIGTASIVAVKEFRCLLGPREGLRRFGGDGWGTLLSADKPVAGSEDFVVPLNIVFKNPADASRVRPWTKAVVTGQVFLVNEFMQRNDLVYQTEYLTVRDAKVQQDPSARAVIEPGGPQVEARLAGPPPEPNPRAEAALRHVIETIATGKPDYVAMTPEQGEHVRRIRTGLQGLLHDAGAIKSMTLLAKNDDGEFVYGVSFEHGANQFSIRLTGAGQADAFSYGPNLAGQPAQTASATPAAATDGAPERTPP